MDGWMIKGKWMIALYCVYRGIKGRMPARKSQKKQRMGS
jgi:hypothetical protein